LGGWVRATADFRVSLIKRLATILTNSQDLGREAATAFPTERSWIPVCVLGVVASGQGYLWYRYHDEGDEPINPLSSNLGHSSRSTGTYRISWEEAQEKTREAHERQPIARSIPEAGWDKDTETLDASWITPSRRWLGGGSHSRPGCLEKYPRRIWGEETEQELEGRSIRALSPLPVGIQSATSCWYLWQVVGPDRYVQESLLHQERL